MPNTANTYSLIQTITLASTGSATFTNIPSQYTDLKLIVNARSTTASDALALTFNGSSFVSSWCRLSGADAATLFVESSSSGTGNFIYGGVSFLSQTGYWGCADIYISNYTSASAKPIQGHGANKSTSPGSQSMSYSGGVVSTGAISQIEVSVATGGAVIQSGSVFSLYGIIKY